MRDLCGAQRELKPAAPVLAGQGSIHLSYGRVSDLRTLYDTFRRNAGGTPALRPYAPAGETPALRRTELATDH